MKSPAITKVSGDVFRDPGFSPAEARNLRLRSELMTSLRKFLEQEGLTQADAAKQLKVSQPRVSDLTRGKISRFSLDTLVNMLTDVGMDVAVKIRRPPRRISVPPTRFSCPARLGLSEGKSSGTCPRRRA